MNKTEIVKTQIEEVIKECSVILKEKEVAKEEAIEKKRILNKDIYEERAWKIISNIPNLIRDAILHPELYRSEYDDPGRIKICNLYKDDILYDKFGWPKAMPGSFAEYLLDKLKNIGLRPMLLKGNGTFSLFKRALVEINIYEINNINEIFQ